MREIKYCDKYVGVSCVDGNCPITLANEYPEIYGYDKCTCEDCYAYKGCEDCMFMSDEGCAHKIINDKFRKLTDELENQGKGENTWN